MIIVYWREVTPPLSDEDLKADGLTEDDLDNVEHICARMVEFDANEMMQALKYAERLRAERREGRLISHVCIQSELPDTVGQAGVSDPTSDYAWYKRRHDPSIPVGRKSIPIEDEA